MSIKSNPGSSRRLQVVSEPELFCGDLEGWSSVTNLWLSGRLLIDLRGVRVWHFMSKHESHLSHLCFTMFKSVYVCVVCSPKRLSARVSHKYWLDCTCNGFKKNIYSGSLFIHPARLTVVWIFFLPFVCPRRIYWSTFFMFNKSRQPSNTRATIIISRVRLANIIYFLLSTKLVKRPKPAMNRFQTMAEMSTQILGWRKRKAPHAAHEGLTPFPLRHRFPNSLWDRSVFWLAQLPVGCPSCFPCRLCRCWRCNTCPRMSGNRKVEDIRGYFTKQSVSHLSKIVPPHRLPLMNAKHCLQPFSHS